MKLRFSIRYDTQWGESLHVVITYYSARGHRHLYDLPMQTADGSLWTVETAVLETRRQTVEAISYHYQVENEQGALLRKEWCLVPRLYSCDSSKDYRFDDQWRDIPLQQHLYTDAYATTQHLPHGDRVRAERLPVFRRTLIFRVSAPQLQAGQSLGICGNHPSLGSWNPSRYQTLNYVGDREWVLSVNAYGMYLPIEYKYVIIDDKTRQLTAWEEGDNRVTPGETLNDGEVLVLHGGCLHVKEATWRVAGVSVPLFSLRSETSFGSGDFGDLKLLIDWAAHTGMKMIELLPLNDTNRDGSWGDSNPYNIMSAFALHPHYLSIEALDPQKVGIDMKAYGKKRRDLNSYAYRDYPAVERVKSSLIHEVFERIGAEELQSETYQKFHAENAFWLDEYASFREQKGQKTDETCWVQYKLFSQLNDVVNYARQQGVALMGDIPTGMCLESVEMKKHPAYFRPQERMGVLPDNDNPLGYNWNLPAYNWASEETVAWMRTRLTFWGKYFDAVRLDHVSGYFCAWQIPADSVSALLGHYAPALPLTQEEIEQFGLPFRRDMYLKPYINNDIIDHLFGLHANYVRSHFLQNRPYGLYDIKPELNTQRRIMEFFAGKNDENSLWIRDGLCRLLENVLFVEDPLQPGMYHPRYQAFNTPLFHALGSEDREAFMRLYNNFFYERHNQYWIQNGEKLLTRLLEGCRMLVVGDTLGPSEELLAQPLDRLRMLTTEVQRLKKGATGEFAHLEAYPYRSLCTISTHDMTPLRLWWEECPGQAQRYYAGMMQKMGRAPQHIPPAIAEEILARHLYSPSMVCMPLLQDWLAMSNEGLAGTVRSERINVPGDSYNRWEYRMTPTLEQLCGSKQYNSKIKLMIERSRR